MAPTDALDGGSGPAALLEAFLAQGRWDEAEAVAYRLLALGKRDPDAHASAVAAMARAAQGRGDTEAMRRWLDRAGRIMEDDGRFREFRASLLLAAGESAQAAELLDAVDSGSRGLTENLALALARWQTGRRAEAAELIEDLLRRYLVTPDLPLAQLAGVIGAADGRAGWVGHSGGGLLRGVLRAGLPPEAAVVVRPLAGNGPPLVDLSVADFTERFGDRPGRARAFSLPLPGLPLDTSAAVGLIVEVEGRPLLGSGLTLSQVLAVEGIVEIEGARVNGWVRCPDLPDFPIELRLTDAAGHRLSAPLAAATDARSAPRRSFSIDLAAAGLVPGRIEVTAGPSDLPLAGSPLQWGAAPPRPASNPGKTTEADPNRTVDIIVPVYGGRAHTLACLRSLFAAAPTAELVVVDDATPDRPLADALDRLAATGRITLLRNPDNRGFPAAVNRGMALHPDRDVVLLNADTLVFGDWLERLKAAAYAENRTGTVTPLSNDATICTYPTAEPPALRRSPSRRRPSSPPLAAADFALLDGAARRVNRGGRVELPTAVGFCMYIRRDCLAETGPFSETLFGRGYGEENDFCRRAARLGWRHQAATDVFVAHVGHPSFGRQRLLLLERNARVLERLHPGYAALVSRFEEADPLAEARRRLDLALWKSGDDRPATLLVTLDPEKDGGVGVHVRARFRSLAEDGRRPLALVPAAALVDADGRSLRRCRLVDPERPELRDLVFETAAEIDRLAALLREAAVTEVEIHHSLHHDAAVLELPGRLGVPHDVVVHDYHWICPRVTLIGAGGVYCGEPDLAACERCRLSLGTEGDEDIGVADLRRRSGELFAAARLVVVPCEDVALRLGRHLPNLRPVLRAWEPAPEVTPPSLPASVVPAGKPAGRVKVCVIGAIGPHKGYDVLLACARDAAARDLPLEFVVVGYSCDDGPLFATGRVFVTGGYDEEEAPALIRAQGADLAFLPSVWPETWCYSLTAAWRGGLPAVAFDLGAQAERIGAGGLLALGEKPSRINDRLLALGGRSMVEEFRPSFPSGLPKDGSMSPFSTPVSSSITATTQPFTLPAGFYAITVLRGGQPHRPGRFPLPAVQVVVPPDGISPGAIELLSGQPGGWLTKAADTILVKIAAEASLLMTSYKDGTPGSDSLEIQVSRVDGAAAPALAVASPPRADVLVHVQRQGDQTAPTGTWSGAVGKNLWVEAFGVVPVEGLTAADVEYKGLAVNGVETPWTTGGILCGTRGQALPLIGFAVALRGAAAEHFDCVYEATFVGGGRSRLCRNGAPCRSDVLGAPLEGILLSFVAKS